MDVLTSRYVSWNDHVLGLFIDRFGPDWLSQFVAWEESYRRRFGENPDIAAVVTSITKTIFFWR